MTVILAEMKEDNTMVIKAQGRLDTVSSPRLEEKMREAAAQAEGVILDFSQLDYISSAGLRVLLFGRKAFSGKGGRKIIHANENIMEILRITGLSEILDIS